MEILDEGELPRPKSDLHTIMVIVCINIILMLFVSLLVRYSSDGDNLSKLLGLAAWLTLQCLGCLIAGAVMLIFKPARRSTGIGLILSTVMTAMVGFGVCVSQYN